MDSKELSTSCCRLPLCFSEHRKITGITVMVSLVAIGALSAYLYFALTQNLSNPIANERFKWLSIVSISVAGVYGAFAIGMILLSAHPQQNTSDDLKLYEKYSRGIEEWKKAYKTLGAVIPIDETTVVPTDNYLRKLTDLNKYLQFSNLMFLSEDKIIDEVYSSYYIALYVIDHLHETQKKLMEVEEGVTLAGTLLSNKTFAYAIFKENLTYAEKNLETEKASDLIRTLYQQLYLRIKELGLISEISSLDQKLFQKIQLFIPRPTDLV